MKRFFLICITLILIFGCAPDGAKELKEEETPLLKVNVMEITPETIRDYITLSGRALASEDIMVSAEIGGKIKIFYKEKGDDVFAGEKLFALEDDSIKNQIDQAKINLDFQEKNFNRSRGLYEKEVISEKNYQDAEFAYKSAQKNYERLRITHSKHTVQSPVSGIIADKFFDEGEFIQPGAPVLNILNLNVVKVQVNIPEKHISNFSEGGRVSLNFSAIEDKEYAGRINFISHKINQSNQTFLCEIIVNNDGKIKSGMLARVLMLRREYKNSVVIPLDAVIQFEKGHGVYLVKDGRSARVIIDIESIINDKVVVKKGIEIGDKLIISGHKQVADDEEVRKVD